MEVSVGRIGRPHGVRGEVTLLLATDDRSRFDAGRRVFTDTGEALTIARSRPYRDKGMIVLFEGVADRNAAELLRGTVLTAPGDERRELESDEFWPEDIVGLDAVDPAGSPLGTVVEVVPGAAQDRLVVETPAGDRVEVPFVSDLVDDPADGRIVVRPPSGMFDPPETG